METNGKDPALQAHSLLEEIALDNNSPVKERIEAARYLLNGQENSEKMADLLLEIAFERRYEDHDRIKAAMSVSFHGDEKLKKAAIDCLSAIASDTFKTTNSRYYAAKAIFRKEVEHMEPLAIGVMKEIASDKLAYVKDRIKAAYALAFGIRREGTFSPSQEEGYDFLLQIAGDRSLSTKYRIMAATKVMPRDFSRKDKKNTAAIWWLLQIAGDDEEDVEQRARAAMDAHFWWNELK